MWQQNVSVLCLVLYAQAFALEISPVVATVFMSIVAPHRDTKNKFQAWLVKYTSAIPERTKWTEFGKVRRKDSKQESGNVTWSSHTGCSWHYKFWKHLLANSYQFIDEEGINCILKVLKNRPTEFW